MKRLEGFQRKYLRGIAHGLKPVVFVGQKGLTSEVILAAGLALESHELIKIKFNDFKGKDQKAELSGLLEKETGSEVVGIIGHTVIFYRQQNNPEKRRIFPPQRKGTSGRTGKAHNGGNESSLRGKRHGSPLPSKTSSTLIFHPFQPSGPRQTLSNTRRNPPFPSPLWE